MIKMRRFLALFLAMILLLLACPIALAEPAYENAFVFTPAYIARTMQVIPVTQSSKVYGTVTGDSGSSTVRVSPDLNAASIGTLTKGMSADFLGETRKDSRGVNWYKISLNGKEGWVSEKYTKLIGNGEPTPTPKPTPTATTTPTPKPTTKPTPTPAGLTGRINATSLYVRKTPGGDKLGSLKNGASVTVLEITADGWGKIRYGSSYGYISMDYVVLDSKPTPTTKPTATPTVTPGTKPTPTPKVTPTPKPTPTPAGCTGKVKATSLYVRKTPGGTKLGSLKNGASVTILEVTSDGWGKIRYGSSYGYISMDYVVLDPLPTEKPTPTPTATPVVTPTATPTAAPTTIPTATPTVTPTATPTAMPTTIPTVTPTTTPTATPATTPTATPTATPTTTPTATPTTTPTATPTATPTPIPTITPTPSTNTVLGASGSSTIRKDPSLDGASLGTLSKGKTAKFLKEIAMDDRGVIWYKIDYNGIIGWVSEKYTTVDTDAMPTLKPTPKPTPKPSPKPTPITLNKKAVGDKKEYPKYKLCVDTALQRVFVLGYDNGSFSKLSQVFICSTGKDTPDTATPLGTFSGKGPGEVWHYFVKYKCWAQYTWQIKGAILFHSVIFNEKGGKPTSSSVRHLGSKASHGCVRLSVEDAKWIYEHCPAGTTVYVYDSKKTPYKW